MAPVAASDDAAPGDGVVPIRDVENATGMWFVQMPSAPTADGTLLTKTRAEKSAWRAQAKKAGLQYSERMAFDRLWNGVSISMDASQLPKLARLTAASEIFPVDRVSLPETTPAEPELFSALGMTGADNAQSELGFTGAGVKVAVMDTGIDIDHPAFGGGGVPGGTAFPSARVAYGHDFVGDAYDGGNQPVPDSNPDDCGGHGTHVAGIVGANDATTGLKGVAPGVTFGAYRVFGCEGSTTTDIMIAAMERALADGMQVLNMSIGSSRQWPQYPSAIAATRLVNKGVVVVASIGNSGTEGLYAASAPGVGDKVIGVASFDNTALAARQFTVSPDDTVVNFNAATGSPAAPLSGVAEMARTGTTASSADACAALPAGSLSGKVALVRRGSCAFLTKALNAEAAGAEGVVIYNNVPGPLVITVGTPGVVTIPVVGIAAADGVLIDGRIAAGPVDLTWTDDFGSSPNPTGGRISSFSSYGLSPTLGIKPDIGAPGGAIYSSYPLEKGGYASLNGTSMASPHVAGGAALLLQARPNTPAQAVGTIFQNSADPKPLGQSPSLGLDNVHRQGAGMIDIDDAILATTRVQPASLALGESEAGPAVRTIEIANSSSTAVTYDLTSINAVSTTSNTHSPGFVAGAASVAYSLPSVTVPANGKATVDATITAPTGPNKGLYGGYLVLTAQSGEVYRVPFGGFVGDYQSIQVLTPTAYGFPWLARLQFDSLYKVTNPGGIFTMAGDDVPYVVAHFDHAARDTRLEVFDAVSGKSWKTAMREGYLARNAGSTGIYGFAFDGTTSAGSKTYTVPDGSYVLKLSVLKALGDSANPAHWETWTTPAFTIDRP